MDHTKRLPDSELALMKIFWQQNRPLTRTDLQQLLPERDWAVPTFQALLTRLEGKGFLCHEKAGRSFVYRALISREEYLPIESRTVLGRLFEGSPARLVAALHEADALSDADIDELYACLQQLREERK